MPEHPASPSISSSGRLASAEQALFDLLGPQLREITDLLTASSGLDSHPYLIDLPNADSVDLPLSELSSLVARTANVYGRMARYQGMARAEYKLAKGRYDRKYKRARVGRNDAERDRAAMDACEEEHAALVVAEAIAELADSYEHAARVASESSRKILGAVQAQGFAASREAASATSGGLRDMDFSPH